jgi:predicted tellurium resistance membrane protein TerC
MKLVVFGIALSIPIVVWGSGILATLMNRFIWIIWIGGGILGYVAGAMIMKDKGFGWIDHSSPVVQWLPVVPAVIIFVLGWWFNSQNGRKKVPGHA